MYQTLLTIFIFTDPCMHTQVYVSSFLWFAISCDSYTCDKRNKLKKEKKAFQTQYLPLPQSGTTLCDLMDCIGCQLPLSMEFPRQKFWSGLPFPTPGDFPNPCFKPRSLAIPTLVGGFFTLRHLGSPIVTTLQSNCLFTLQR